MSETKLARKAAFRLLSMRSYHSLKLRQKLEEKGFSKEVCDEVIEDCRRLGFLQDEAFLSALILREFRKGYGPRYIERKLRSQGLSADQIRDAITPSMQSKRIGELVAKLKLPAGRLGKQKAAQTLQRRGFDLDLIFKHLC